MTTRPRDTCRRCTRDVAVLGTQRLAMHRCLAGLVWPVRDESGADVSEAEQLAGLRAAEQAWRERVVDCEVTLIRCETVLRSVGEDPFEAAVMGFATAQAGRELAGAGEMHERVQGWLFDVEVALL